MKFNNPMKNKINNTYKKQEQKNMSETKHNDVELNAENGNDSNETATETKTETAKSTNTNENTLEELTAKNVELEDMLKRRVAEFDNYKKRTDKEKLELLEYGNARILSSLIDLLDDLRNANDAAKKHPDIASLQAGIEMIYQKADKIFSDQGVKLIDISVGDEFDVNIHEALMRQASELAEGLITMILQPGYMYKDKIIRYAKVATSAGE
jgi:molecular chaperone GrpE